MPKHTTKRRQRMRQRKTKAKTRKKSYTQSKKPSITNKYPPPKHLKKKKLGLLALSAMKGITPFKRNSMQVGESGVRNIELDTSKYYKINPAVFKLAKTYNKDQANLRKKLNPTPINPYPEVERPLSRYISQQYPPSSSFHMNNI